MANDFSGAGFDSVYAELRRIAAFHMRRERDDHTLQATALVHEAFMILARRSKIDWDDHSQVVAMAVTAMRHFLIDYARRKAAVKHGGTEIKVPLTDAFAYNAAEYTQLMTIDAALRELELIAPREAKVVELRIFGGYSEVEISTLLGKDVRTIRRYWKGGQEFLRKKLEAG